MTTSRPLSPLLVTLVIVAAALAGLPAAAAAQPVWTSSFARGASGWRFTHGVKARRVPWAGERRLRIAAGPTGGLASHSIRGAGPYALSMDISVDRGATLGLALTRSGQGLVLRRRPNGGFVVKSAEGATVIRDWNGNPATRWVHVEASSRAGAVAVALDGTPVTLRGRPATSLSLSIRSGRALVGNVLVSSLGDKPALLVHRLAELHFRLSPTAVLVGATQFNKLMRAGAGWTSGFLAGALWEASSRAGGDLLASWALSRTIGNFGFEYSDTHDLGFEYEPSSGIAYERLCRPPRHNTPCAELRSSALSAADALLALADTNRDAGTIPTHTLSASDTESDTIIDSMMNLGILFQASDLTGDPSFRTVAARHAARVAELLVRPDGSTYQSVHLTRDGQVLRRHTHQGLSDDSTWARGQAWAVYGFTRAAAALHDVALLRVAEQTATWLVEHLPASGQVPWDFSAINAVPDTSAGVIASAGLLRLDQLCRQWTGACVDPARWRPAALKTLNGALQFVSSLPPLGYFASQVGTYGTGEGWNSRAEFPYGLFYALQAANLAAASPSGGAGPEQVTSP